MWSFRLFGPIAAVLILISKASALTYIPVGDEFYDILLRLEAEGVIKSALTSTLPISRAEAGRLLREAMWGREAHGPYVNGLIDALEKGLGETGGEGFIKPADDARIGLLYADSETSAFYYNDDGVQYERGANIEAGIASIAELGRLSLRFDPEVRGSEDDAHASARRAYGVLSVSGLDIVAGRDSLWWGPGHHGALLFSNNPRPLTMLRITNPDPVLLPWAFRVLGPLRFDMFVTRLEKDRAVPEPYLWGLRIDFKPHPYVELGLERTALLGGEGRPSDIETWWRSFTTSGENDPDKEPGDQRAGLDARIVIPFRWQHVEAYAEVAGEDNEEGLPSKRAYLAGAYLPGPFGIEPLELRAEYASTRLKKHPGATWYSHHTYRTGYTYKGRTIGHHMGGDSDDFFLMATYIPPGPWRPRISVSYDRQRHGLSGHDAEESEEYSTAFELSPSEDVSFRALYLYGKIEDKSGQTARDDDDVNILAARFMVRF